MNNERLKNERNKLNSQLKRKDEIIRKLKEEKVNGKEVYSTHTISQFTLKKDCFRKLCIIIYFI